MSVCFTMAVRRSCTRVRSSSVPGQQSQMTVWPKMPSRWLHLMKSLPPMVNQTWVCCVLRASWEERCLCEFRRAFLQVITNYSVRLLHSQRQSQPR